MAFWKQSYIYGPYNIHGNFFYIDGKLRIKVHQKPENRYMSRNRKIKVHMYISEVKYSSRAKFLGAIPGDNCYFQGTREMEAYYFLFKISQYPKSCRGDFRHET